MGSGGRETVLGLTEQMTARTSTTELRRALGVMIELRGTSFRTVLKGVRGFPASMARMAY